MGWRICAPRNGAIAAAGWMLDGPCRGEQGGVRKIAGATSQLPVPVVLRSMLQSAFQPFRTILSTLSIQIQFEKKREGFFTANFSDHHFPQPIALTQAIEPFVFTNF